MEKTSRETFTNGIEEKPEKKNKVVAGTYTADRRLNLRAGAGLDKHILCVMEKGIKVKCDGGYTLIKDVRWYCVQTTISGVTYTGFCDSNYLVKE